MKAGSRLGPYEVLAPLGAGGMGEVWKARDLRLGREVAVKVLSASFSADPDRLRRFEQEAQAASALNHPNILTIHDFGNHDGSPYVVSELLEGETLRARLVGGAFTPRKALGHALQIASGLAAAHEKGIVHRDLKPENIFVTRDGRVKILDFGLAKLTQSETVPIPQTEAPTVGTEPGVVLGTIGYMSPEQVRGRPADPRSDIFSFGAILYEMLSGQRAFRGDTNADTMSAILNKDPPDLSATNRQIPPGLDRIVRHCLEKDPELRFQSARDLAFDLEALSSAPTASGVVREGPRRRIRLLWSVLSIVAAVAIAAAAMILIRQTGPKTAPSGRPAVRIVVLPFENLGGPEDGYFAAGITEEITSRLASIQNLAVISRTTATQYDRKGKTVQRIGKDLGVDYVLEGSVRWDKRSEGPGRVRITPQLIRVSDDTHLWTDRYDRQLSDIFAIQGDVADGVVRALGVTLAPVESSATRKVLTRDLEAYDLYLRALALEKQNQERSAVAEQIRLAGAAVERDPEFAEALALLAYARARNHWFNYDRRESELERARVEAERAVALRPDSAETHLALAYYHYYGHLDYDAALAEFGKALALQPNEARLHAAIGYIRRRQGKMEEAEAELQKGVGGDPKNGTIYYNLGETQLLLRKYPEAIRNLDISTSLDPKYTNGYTYQAWAHLLWHGDIAAAKLILKTTEIHDLEDPDGSLDYFSVVTALLARDWKRALEIVDKPQPDVLSPGLQFEYFPRSLLRAEVQSYTGRQDLARSSYEEARRILVAKISEEPEDPHFHSSLGIALAGLGQKAEALREGERGVELMPPAREAYRGILRVEDLALIHTIVGNHDAAIKNLDLLLSRPSWISVPLLRLDPRWDPLRKNPKFEALLVKYGVRS